MRVLKHIMTVLVLLAVLLGLPAAHFARQGTLFGPADAVSGASLVVPDQPSGTFFVLLNEDRHPATGGEWEKFFREQEVDVIMEDISCLVTRGDAAGAELAERYLARLAENQMKLTAEDGTLVASRAENGLFDVIIISADAEPVYDYGAAFARPGTAVIEVAGGSPGEGSAGGGSGNGETGDGQT